MKLPKGQKSWVRYLDERGRVTWLIASDPARTVYYLYQVRKGELEQVKKASSPQGFEKIMGRRV